MDERSLRERQEVHKIISKDIGSYFFYYLVRQTMKY